MTFSGKAGYNLSLEFLLHFTTQSCLSNDRKIISKTWSCYNYVEAVPISWWCVSERYKHSKLDSGLHGVIVRLILPLLKHLRMRSYDVKTPQSFWSGFYLITLIGAFWTCNSPAAFPPYCYHQPSFFLFFSCLLVLIKSQNVIPSTTVISDAPKWKTKPLTFLSLMVFS